MISSIVPQSLPVGTMLMYGGQKSKLPSNWKVCDGSEISRSAYPEYFNIVGSAWGSGNGLNTVNLPDCRGYFPRGLDEGGLNYDPDRASRSPIKAGGASGVNVGSYQADALQNITGELLYDEFFTDWTFNPTGAVYTRQGGNGSYTNRPVSSRPTTYVGIDASRVARTSTETRPKNFAIHFIIKVA